MPTAIVDLGYLFASVLFILGIKGLTHPRTAVRGNQISATGMLLALVVTLLAGDIVELQWIAASVAVGVFIGGLLALRVPMTGMPELVAAFNGFGGGASVMVAAAELLKAGDGGAIQATVATSVSASIGTITFFGSAIALLKLMEIKAFKKPLRVSPVFNALTGLAVIALAVMVVTAPAETQWFWGLVAVSSLLGVTLVVPIGGADMPVVVALLNSYSGLAAAATGFVLNNSVLIIAGSLVGASGLILSAIMCKAMNRSLANVLFGRIEAGAATATADEVYEGKVKSTSADEVAMLMDGVQRVVIVPGYGMAVAQAQHAVRDLCNLLESRGVDVQFGIHPVAGRMPGHMNVLLAEVNIPYDKLVDMETINPGFEQVDVSIVLGANDVVNPDARENPDSPIAGMPILNVDKSRMVVVIKRSLSPGFAGIPNPLFAMENTLMFFGDGKKAVLDLISALKEN